MSHYEVKTKVEILERCDSPDHWMGVILWGYCSQCKHKLSPFVAKTQDK